MSKFKQILIIFMSLLLFLTTPELTVNAVENNAGGSGSGGGETEGISGGASENKCGFRMYIVDEQGTIKSKVIDLVNQTPSYNINYTSTRIGNGNAIEFAIKPSDMPKPFIHDNGSFQGNGQAVKAWMLGQNVAGEQNAYSVIYNYLGEDAYKLFEDMATNYYLILEPIAWHDIFSNKEQTSNTGIGFYGTFYNWLQLYNASGLSNGGFTAQLDNKILGRCMAIVRDQPDLNLTMPTSNGLIDLSNLGTQGYGMHIYWNRGGDGDGDSTHTWDSITYPTIEGKPPLPPTPPTSPTTPSTPATTPNPTDPNYQYTIIKSYRLRDAAGNLTDKGTFTREQTVSTIRIEDEPLNSTDKNYKVIGWKSSTAKDINISSLGWETSVPQYIGSEGTTPTITTLDPQHKILYVLLEANISTPTHPGYNYILPESSITRQIDYSIPDFSSVNMSTRINNYTFSFMMGGHTITSCTGHTWYHRPYDSRIFQEKTDTTLPLLTHYHLIC